MHFIQNSQLLTLILYAFQLSRNSACPSLALITAVSLFNSWSAAACTVFWLTEWSTLMACSHRRRDETRQFCLVSSCAYTADKTVLSRLDPVSMNPCWRCEHNWRRDKTFLSCRDGGVNTTADKTRQFCLVSNCVHTANSTRQDSFVSCASAVWTSHNRTHFRQSTSRNV